MNLSWIDRFYVNGQLGDWGGSIRILAGTCLFNHSPCGVGDIGGWEPLLGLFTDLKQWIPESVQTNEVLSGQIG